MSENEEQAPEPTAQERPAEEKLTDVLPVKRLIILLLVSVVVTAAMLNLVLLPKTFVTEVIEKTFEGKEAEGLQINSGQVIDTGAKKSAKARVGYRYRVTITDESFQGAQGVTRIGGLVTMVSNARVGEELIVEVTEVKAKSVLATVVKRLGGDRVRAAKRKAGTKKKVERTMLEVGTIHTAKIVGEGKKGDGVARVRGKTVYVKGAKQGDRARFKIVEESDAFATGELMVEQPKELPVPKKEKPPRPRPMKKARPKLDPNTKLLAMKPLTEPKANELIKGAMIEVEVTEKDRRTPDNDGVARVDGLIVFIKNTQPGDRVRAVITKRSKRYAHAQVVKEIPKLETPTAESVPPEQSEPLEGPE